MKVFTIVLACAFLFSCGRKPARPFPDEINTTKLPTHVNIPGTRVYIVPPAGFKPTKDLPAFDRNGEVLIQAMDEVGENFYEEAEEYTKEGYEKGGEKVLVYKEVYVNGHRASFAIVEDDEDATTYNLVFGDSTFLVRILGIFNSGHATAEAEVWQALTSVYYDTTITIDPFATAPFVLDDSHSIFKFKEFATSIYTYRLRESDVKSAKKKGAFIVAVLPFEDETMEELAASVTDVAGAVEVKHVVKGKTNGFPSYKREVYGEIAGVNVLQYQHIVVMGTTAIVMQGIAYDQYEKYITEFEALANTIRRRQ